MSKASQRRAAERRARESKFGYPSQATLKALIRDGEFLVQFEPAKYLRLMGEALPPDTTHLEDPKLLPVFERHKPMLTTLGKVTFERAPARQTGLPSVPGFMIFDNFEAGDEFPQYSPASVVWRHDEDDFDYEWEIGKAFDLTDADTLTWVFSSDGQPRVMICICASREGSMITRILAKDVWVTPRSMHMTRVLVCSESRMDVMSEEDEALIDLVNGMRSLANGGENEDVVMEMEDLARSCVDKAQHPYLNLSLTMTAAARDARVALAKVTARLEELEKDLAASEKAGDQYDEDRLAKAYARESELRAALARAEASIAAQNEARSALSLPGRLAEFF